MQRLPLLLVASLTCLASFPSLAGMGPLAAKSTAGSETAVGSTTQVPAPLWEEGSTPSKSADLPVLSDVRFSVIKPYSFHEDGYRFLHGVALCFHRGRLFASIGHNRGGENTDTEEARFCVSEDEGATWSSLATMDGGVEPGIGVSHGVFLSHSDQLWAFHGAYSGTLQNVHTRAYRWDESQRSWTAMGTVIADGFWPLGEPQRLANGNWIMSGFRAGQGNPPAVAISRGDDFTRWDLIVIPLAPNLGEVWGESAILVSGPRITNIARWGREARAIVSVSDNLGRTWSPAADSGFPMATSKPCAGVLSTGQRFLICSTSADGGKRRSPLTIAVSRPGETTFCRVFVIRHAEFPGGPGESHSRAALSYPCAVEHQGKVYIGYSNSGGGVGRVGTGRELWNNNSAEMAVIPLASLAIDP